MWGTFGVSTILFKWYVNGEHFYMEIQAKPSIPKSQCTIQEAAVGIKKKEGEQSQL